MERNAAGSFQPDAFKTFETVPYYCLILSPDLRVLNASNAYLKLVGRTREVMLGWNVFDVFDQNSNWLLAMEAGLKQSMLTALDTKLRHEMPVVRFFIPNWDEPEQPTNESYWVISHTPVCNEQGKVLYFTHDINNITAQVMWEKRLQESLEQERQASAKANFLSGQMKMLFEAIPAQIAIVTGPSFIYEYVNPQYRQQLLTGQDPIGRTVAEMIPGAKETPVWSVLKDTYQNGTTFIRTEIKVPILGGRGKTEDRYFNLVYQPWKNENGEITGVLSFKYEITDAVHARKQLELREQELLEVNQELSQALEELRATNEELEASAEALHLANRELHATVSALSAANTQLEEVQESLMQANADLEERVRSRTHKLEELQHTAEGEAERLRFMLNAIPQQVWTTDPEGKLLAVNDILSNDLGYAPAEILEKGLPHFAHVEDLPLILEGWKEALRSGTEYTAEYRLRFADGVYRWHLCRAVPLVEGGKVTFWLGTNTNIDTQKENEQRKDEFLSIASHELKTPLTSIKSFNQMMNRVRDGQQMGIYIQKSFNNILRLERLINDLLDVTKINAGKMIYDMHRFDLLDMVRETIDNVQLTVSSHEIILNSVDVLEIVGDRMRLEQVMVNLLDNAIKYSPGGEEVLVRVSKEADSVIIGVQDYGVGIDKRNLNKLFDRYYRSDNTAMRFEGLGLGLFISAEIVRRHQGTYWLESEPGKGSTFYFRLPLEVGVPVQPISDESKYYKDDYVEISYNAAARRIEAYWSGYQRVETVQRGGLKILDLVRINRAEKLLNDNTQVLGNWSESAEWVAKDLLVSLEQAGLRHMAWVQSNSAFSQLSAHKTVEISTVNIELAFFSDVTAAELWLDHKV
jgi:PAS domain S-box-containing protein